MDDRSDSALLRAWQGGTAGAFEALVGRYQTALLRHARALLGPGRSAEDVVQETFLRLAQTPPVLEESASGAPLASWLHRVTRNLCMDTTRTEARRRSREERAAAHEAISGGLSEVEAADTRAAVERSLSKLPDDQREVLVLRLLGERSYQEIAAITGKKVGTIGWLLSVGLKALASELAPLAGLADGASASTPRAQASGLQGGLR
jgi:RNA polymerase sigma-70 factor (ECF subfamily)